MSNTIIKGEVVFSCDAEDCDEYLETDTRDFREANDIRKAEGWTAFQLDGAWEHRCPGCKKAKPGHGAPGDMWWDRD